jgi:hypothetical protein
MNETSSGAPASLGIRVSWPQSRNVASFEGVLFLFVLAIPANIRYCAAYFGDVFVQTSGFREV